MAESTIVTTRPTCDFCDQPAHFDGRTAVGPWAYMCGTHWQQYGVGRLGTGYGQRLILKKARQ